MIGFQNRDAENPVLNGYGLLEMGWACPRRVDRETLLA